MTGNTDDHTHPEAAELPALLRGELDNVTVLRTRAHLESCDRCRQALLEAATGHALALRAATTLAPHTSVHRPPAVTVERDLPPLPTLPHRGRHLLPMILVAATVLVAALVVGLLRPWATEEPTTPVAADRSATLEPLAGDGGGSVSMVTSGSATRMVIETRDLPAPGPGQFYYAWLLDPTTNKMLPLGQVGTGGPSTTVTFEFADGLLDAYSAVDVSLEDDDGDPEHSPTSVLRASYA